MDGLETGVAHEKNAQFGTGARLSPEKQSHCTLAPAVIFLLLATMGLSATVR